MNETLSAIVGGLIALIGVLLTLRVTQRNFEANLKEEREKAREERTFTAKHMALLSAAEAVTRFIHYYVTLADREISKGGTVPTEVSEMSVSLNRLHFYCEIETIRQAIDLGRILSTSYATAMKAKMPSLFLGEDLNAVAIQIAALETINARLQEEITALLSADSRSPLLVSHRQQLATNFKNISSLHSKRADLFKSKYKATEDCRDVIGKDLKRVFESLTGILLMARRELSFPIDEGEYSAVLTQSTEAALHYMETFVEEVREEVNKRMK